MDLLLILSTFCLVLTAVLLIAIILLQGAQDDSGGSIAASKMNQMRFLGAAQAANLLEKLTSTIAVLFVVFILTTSYIIKNRYDAKYRTSEAIEKIKSYVVSEEQKKS